MSVDLGSASSVDLSSDQDINSNGNIEERLKLDLNVLVE